MINETHRHGLEIGSKKYVSFSFAMNSLFFTTCSGVLFSYWKHPGSSPCQPFLHYSKDQMKRETSVVSTHQSRNEKSSLLQYFSFTNLRLEFAAFSSYQYSVSLLSATNLIFDLSESNFASCPYLHISFVFWAFHRARLLTVPWPAPVTQKRSNVL